MKVFKFGGASLKDAPSVKNMAAIMTGNVGYEIVVVVSAMGKTTNKLEKAASDYFNGLSEAPEALAEVREFHVGIAKNLFPDSASAVFGDLEREFAFLLEIMVKMKRQGLSYDCYYDQVIPYGEVFSCLLVSHYLNTIGLYTIPIDARKLIATDETYRSAVVDVDKTNKNLRRAISFSENCIYITQGFIASSSGGLTTTLGREGSDYTAALVASALKAEEVVIWKDVPGLLNADPRHFRETKKLRNISYHEAVELAYYGATIIHPKTIKPLQNAGIPLYVKSFSDSTSEGSLINDNSSGDSIIPSFIVKENQVLLSLFTRDYSFIDEVTLAYLFGLFAGKGIKINLMEHSAIGFSACIDHEDEKLKDVISVLSPAYRVLYNTGLSLLTIRHYDQASIDKATANRDILVEQRSRHNVRFVLKGKINP